MFARRIKIHTPVIRVSNYKLLSEEELVKLKRNYPLNPDAGMWIKVKTKDTRWITLPQDNAQGQLEVIEKFFEANKDKYTDIVTIGMGGSSRPTDVVKMFQELLQTKGVNIHVLETLDENTINALLEELKDRMKTTLFIIISKSGTTAETNALARLIAEDVDFIAITDKTKSGSELYRFLTEEKGVSPDTIMQHPDRVGGRYTFFSNIGILPAVFAFADIAKAEVLLREARAAMYSDIKYQLGKFLADMEKSGRRYMRVVLPEGYERLGLWIEQLIAESLGKLNAQREERGIIALMERDYKPQDPVYKRDDYFIFRVKLEENDSRDEFMEEIEDVPIFEFTISRPEQIAYIMYSLEFATGMAGIEIGIDPFDQPGVDGGKEATNTMKKKMRAQILSQLESEPDKADDRDYIFEIAKERFDEIITEYKNEGYRVKIKDGIVLDYGDFVTVYEEKTGKDFKERANKEGIDLSSAREIYSLILKLAKEEGIAYSAVLPYDETFKNHNAWRQARFLMRKLGFHDIFGLGPVYEHSYRQYFMQGPNEGIFTFIVSYHHGEIQIPYEPGLENIKQNPKIVPGLTFAMQNALQALGTMEALINDDMKYKIARRFAVRIEIDGKFDERVMQELEEFFSQIIP